MSTSDPGRPGDVVATPSDLTAGVPEPRPEVRGLHPYVTGRPAGSEDGSLASNESPFGASPAVTAALQAAAARLHRYPDPLAGSLRRLLGSRLAVDPDSILVANGSDELVYLLTLAYAAGGGSVVCADPPYRIHDIAARIVGASVRRVPLRDWVHDLQAMTLVEADIAFVCNPHNPTGTTVTRDELRSFVSASRARLVVVDEAYIDFVDAPEATTMVGEASGKLVVTRTLSKAYGLAGARVGYLVGSPLIVDYLRRIRPPFSVGTLGQAAAEAAIADDAHRESTRELVRAGRRRLTDLFEAAGYTVVPSQTNFVLVVTGPADDLVGRLERRGVSVRPGSALEAPGTVRVTVPSEKGFALLEQALAPER